MINGGNSSVGTPPGAQPGTRPASPSTRKRRFVPTTALLIGLVGLAVVFGAYRILRGRKQQATPVVVAKPLVVVPFTAASGDTAQDYLAEGMSAELVTALSRNRGLRLAPSVTASVLKRQGKNVQQVGSALHARTVIEGTVRRGGSRIAITVAMRTVADGAQLWADQFEGSAGDLIALQATLEQRVASALQSKLGVKPPKSVMPHGTTDAEAFDLYLHGKTLLAKRVDASTRRSAVLFHEAIARDTGFARAYGGLAVAEMLIALATQKPDNAQLAAVVTHGQHALDIDPSNPDGHLAIGYLMQYRTQDATVLQTQGPISEQHFKRALAQEPWRPLDHEWYGDLLQKLGRYDEGLDQVKLAQEIEPTSARIASEVANMLFNVRYQAALAQNMQSSALDTVLALGFKNYSGALAFLHRSDEMVRAFRQVLSLDANYPNARGHMVYALAATNKRADATKIADDLLRDGAALRTTAYEVAVSRMGLGDVDGALRWLRKSVESAEPETGPRRLPCDPYFDPLQSDVRFMDILRKIGGRSCPRG